MCKMYVAVRKDLKSIYKMVQGSHGLAQFALEHTQLFNKWHNETIVFIDVKNINGLITLANKLEKSNVKFSVFREPDIGNELTSIVFLDEGGATEIVRKYNCARES